MSDTTAPTRVRSRIDLDAAVQRIGVLDKDLEKLRLAEAKAKQRITAKYAADIAVLATSRSEQIERVRAYVADNVSLVFGDKKKSITDAGELALKKLRTRLVVEDETAAIAHLESAHLDGYLRRSTDLDKNALLKDRPAVPGLDYAEAEQLVIIPITSGDRISVTL